MWHVPGDVERLDVPADLADALEGNGVRAVWEAYPKSIKWGTLEWIKRAKAAPAGSGRIHDVVDPTLEGLRPSPFRR